jgi:hypothetical protein
MKWCLNFFVFKKYLIAMLVHFYDLVAHYLLIGGWYYNENGLLDGGL